MSENLKSRHAFGKLQNLDSAIDRQLIDSYDILFMTDEDNNAVIGWIDADGNKVILENKTQADLTALENQVSDLETQMSSKVDETAVQSMVNVAVESAVKEATSNEVVEF